MKVGGLDIREYFFNPEWNPAIRFFKAGAIWVILNYPDLHETFGPIKWIRRVIFIFAVVGLTGWLVTEGLTPINFLFKGIIMSLIVLVFYLKILASIVFSFFFLWETKGMAIFTNDP